MRPSMPVVAKTSRRLVAIGREHVGKHRPRVLPRRVRRHTGVVVGIADADEIQAAVGPERGRRVPQRRVRRERGPRVVAGDVRVSRGNPRVGRVDLAVGPTREDRQFPDALPGLRRYGHGPRVRGRRVGHQGWQAWRGVYPAVSAGRFGIEVALATLGGPGRGGERGPGARAQRVGIEAHAAAGGTAADS